MRRDMSLGRRGKKGVLLIFKSLESTSREIVGSGINSCALGLRLSLRAKKGMFANVIVSDVGFSYRNGN